MTKFLDKFLEFKNEADATRKFALFAVVIITLGLASLSVTGIIATANWAWPGIVGSFLPMVGMIIAVLGAEMLATVAFIRTLTAPTLMRRIAGAFIFVGLAAVGVHNAENGAHVVWPDRFSESSTSLAAKSGVSQHQADTAGADRPVELARTRDEIAKLEVFTKKMSAQTPEGIKEAQSEMIPRCGYAGAVDGIRAEKTESAMRSCGEQIRGEIAVLKQRETNLLAPAATVAVAGAVAPVDPAIEAINLQGRADAAFWNWLWLIIMLCTLEGARSLSLWALITGITGQISDKERERDEALAEAQFQAELAAIRGAQPAPAAPQPVLEPEAAPEPEPVAAETGAEPEPEPLPELDLTDAQRRGRAGGQATAQKNAAAKAKAARAIPIASTSALDALKIAAE